MTQRDWLALAGLLLASVLLKAALVAAAGLELHFDEAQYWEWSQQLDWSYYSKGPLAAWLIALSESLFGHGEWQTRLFGWLAHAAFVALVFGFTRQVWHSRTAAWWAVVLTLLTPMYFALSLVMTTDNLLLVFWTWGLWAAYRALILGRRLAWYEAGAAVGLGALTKLSIGLMPALVGLLVLLHPRWRVQLRDPHLWGALALMLVCMSPVLLWNASHDWVMFRHEMGHVGSDGWSLGRVGEFVAGQWGVLSPLIVALAVPVLGRRPAEERLRFLWTLGLLWLAFFIWKALNGNVQLNWPAPVYVVFLILFAGHIEHFSTARRRGLYAGFGLAALLLAVAFFPNQFGLRGDRDPFIKLKYWREPIADLQAHVPPAQFLLTDTYHLAGELAFYWPQPLPVYITGSASRRFNQHDLWPPIDREAGKSGLYISTSPVLPEPLGQAFADCRRQQPLVIQAPDGRPVRTLYASWCRDYRPIDWPKPTRY